MKVLIAIDGSKIARKALEYPIIPSDQHFFVLAHQEKEKKAKELLREMEVYIKDNRIKGEVNNLFGDIGHEIVKRANDIDASLIITGSRGLGVLTRTILGSVSDYIVHHSEVPVVVYTDSAK